ncbi:MAG: response regulator [Bacteroidota bacterium]
MNTLQLLLADDDADDCIFFREALEELPIATHLNTVNDGVQLMQYLHQNERQLPHILYLDMNMPRKNGVDCLREIKLNPKLITLPVIIFSTSIDHDMAEQLHEYGAHYYIRKPAEFSKLKKVILRSIHLISEPRHQQPDKENFILTET